MGHLLGLPQVHDMPWINVDDPPEAPFRDDCPWNFTKGRTRPVWIPPFIGLCLLYTTRRLQIDGRNGA